MFRSGIAAIAFVAMLAEGAAAQTLPFEGKWALQPENCRIAPDGSPTQSGAPITITAKRLVATPVMTCDFTSVLPGGASFRVEAACQAGDRKGNEFFTFAVLGGRLYWSWAGKTQSFERCPD